MMDLSASGSPSAPSAMVADDSARKASILKAICAEGDWWETSARSKGLRCVSESGAKRMDSPPLATTTGRVLARGVEDDDLVIGVSEDGVLNLALDGERLAGAGLARDEAHGARQALAVAEHEVRGLLVLAVVAAARLRELLGREGHLYGDLGGGHHAGDLHVAVPSGSTEFRPSRCRKSSASASMEFRRAVDTICITWSSNCSRVGA